MPKAHPNDTEGLNSIIEYNIISSDLEEFDGFITPEHYPSGEDKSKCGTTRIMNKNSVDGVDVSEIELNTLIRVDDQVPSGMRNASYVYSSLISSR